MRLALYWSLIDQAEKGPAVTLAGLKLALSLFKFWTLRSRLREGWDWYRKALAALDKLDLESGKELKLLKAGILWKTGALGTYLNEVEETRPLFEQSMVLCRELGDKSGLAYSLGFLGHALTFYGDTHQARTLLEQSVSLFRELEDREGLAQALSFNGWAAFFQRDIPAARSLFEESVSVCRTTGNNWVLAHSLSGLSSTVTFSNEFPYAWAWKSSTCLANPGAGC